MRPPSIVKAASSLVPSERIKYGRPSQRPMFSTSVRDGLAGLVRRLGPRVLLERGAHLGSDHHQRSASISPSTSSASQKEAERYFQPASARIATITPSSSSAASLRATWTTAPAETPANTPSSSSSARTPATASAFETSSLRSSFETSRIGGT